MQGNRGFRPPHLLHDQLIRLTIWISTLSFPALDPIVFVRSTQALWTAGTVTLLAIVLRGIGCSPVAISVGSLLCATNGAVWFNSSHIMSYAPTYFFTLLTTYTFINWIRSRSIKWVAALGASLAAVTWMHQAGCFLGIPILIGAAMSRDKRVFLITLFATALSGLMVFLSYLVVAMFLGNHEPYAIYRWIAKYPSHPNWGSAVHMLDLHRAATGLSGAFLGYSTASPTGIRSFLLGWTGMTLLVIVLIFTDRAKRTDPVLIFLMIQAWGYMGFAIYWVPDFSWTYGFGVLAWIIIWSTVAGGIGLDGWRHRLLSTLYIALSCWLAGIQVVYGMVGVRRDSVPERDEESLFASMALKASKPGDVFILNSYFAEMLQFRVAMAGRPEPAIYTNENSINAKATILAGGRLFIHVHPVDIDPKRFTRILTDLKRENILWSVDRVRYGSFQPDTALFVLSRNSNGSPLSSVLEAADFLPTIGKLSPSLYADLREILGRSTLEILDQAVERRRQVIAKERVPNIEWIPDQPKAEDWQISQDLKIVEDEGTNIVLVTTKRDPIIILNSKGIQPFLYKELEIEFERRGGTTNDLIQVFFKSTTTPKNLRYVEVPIPLGEDRMTIKIDFSTVADWNELSIIDYLRLDLGSEVGVTWRIWKCSLIGYEEAGND